ncbi:MAG TPA: serine/threonine-protein kinase [Kofleriaceae bacterium]|nr:serine/threonine-protein kinase [Kofleriaceae bacterium]
MEGTAGTGERFELRGQLGVGASGAVYRVLDRERGEEVALKTLRRVSGADLYRFKREFRALTGVHHPNLATLHELFVVGNEWMFTMELVDGERFDEWVRPAGALDQARLRSALRQLVDGLCALHAIGKIHRDLKPSNVLVDHSGRTVILDFGLAVHPGNIDRTHEGGSVGTIAYMSPEQALDLPLGPATDWYAVGVMLFEGLTGKRPLRGALHDVLLRKQLDPAPLELPDDAPADLAELCRRLLERDPERRADGAAVMAVLGAELSEATRAIAIAATARRSTPCDPDALAALREAFKDSRDHLVAVIVRGPSGSGKSALYETFVDEVRRTDALVMAAADNQREQTPMPVVDQAIDQLSTYLIGLPRSEAEDIVRDAAPLARVFPALRRVPPLQLPTLPHGKATSPAEIFREGIQALRRVLFRISLRRPLLFAADNGRGPGQVMAEPLVDHFTAGEESERPRILLMMVIRPDALPGNALVANFVRWRDERGGDLRFIDMLPPHGGDPGG